MNEINEAPRINVYIFYKHNESSFSLRKGGINTLIHDVRDYCLSQGISCKSLTFMPPALHDDHNVTFTTLFLSFLKTSIKSKKCKDIHVLFSFGCGTWWSYIVPFFFNALNAKTKIYWHTSYHYHKFVKNKLLARLSLGAIRILSKMLGSPLTICAQTKFELDLYKNTRKILVSFWNREKCQNASKNYEASRTHFARRQYDFAFLGRPTYQKGWHIYLDFINRAAKERNVKAIALIPYKSIEKQRKYDRLYEALTEAGTLTSFMNISENNKYELLNQTKTLLVFSDYESFGLAQAEGIMSGCFVPILGQWPLWNDLTSKEGGSDLRYLHSGKLDTRKLMTFALNSEDNVAKYNMWSMQKAYLDSFFEGNDIASLESILNEHVYTNEKKCRSKGELC